MSEQTKDDLNHTGVDPGVRVPNWLRSVFSFRHSDLSAHLLYGTNRRRYSFVGPMGPATVSIVSRSF